MEGFFLNYTSLFGEFYYLPGKLLIFVCFGIKNLGEVKFGKTFDLKNFDEKVY